MIKMFNQMTQTNAARLVGLGFIAMFFLVIFAELYVFQNVIVEGDAALTALNISSNAAEFNLAVLVYLVIIAVDIIIALALYVVLRPVGEKLALVSSSLRLVFDAIMVISLLALAFRYIDAYFLGKLVAYLFSISTIFSLGYIVVFRADHIPRSLGWFLLVASASYVILLYGEFIMPASWLDILVPFAIIPATFAELSLGVWLLARSSKLADLLSASSIGGQMPDSA